MSSHHRQLDRTEVVSSTDSLILRRHGDRHVIVVRPRLEDCFLRSMSLVGLSSELASRPMEMHALLGIPGSTKHQAFQEELKRLHEESTKRNVRTLITDLEDTVRGLVAD